MESYMGLIYPSAIGWAPIYFSLCNGAQLQVSQMQALYAVIGYAYGGNQTTTFNLPDLRGRQLVGAGQSSLGGLTYSNGNNGGSPTPDQQHLAAAPIVLSSANLTPHTHASSFFPVVSAQTVAIPGSPASGTLTASGSISMVPGVDGSAVASAAGGQTYFLTGANVPPKPTALAGPYTQTKPSGTPATLSGMNVNVDASQYTAATAATTAKIPVVTGGSVQIGTAGQGVPFTPAVAPMPWEVVTFIICTQGLYPSRQ